MKKLMITILTVAALAFTMTACSPAPSGSASHDPAAPDAASSDETVAKNTTAIYGKVSKLVGNEISLELAKAPEMPEGGDNSGLILPDNVITPAEGGENSEKSGSDSEYSIETGEAKSAQVPGGDDEQGNSGDSQTNFNRKDESKRLELEYTGETRDFTISAGTPIVSLANGSEGKMTDIREGSVLTLIQNEDGSLNMIYIME